MSWIEKLKKWIRKIWKHRYEIDDAIEDIVKYMDERIPSKIPDKLINDRGWITEKEVKEVVLTQTNHINIVDFKIPDKKFKVTDLDTMKIIVPIINISKYRKYELPKYDCDNYAAVFNGVVKFVLSEYAIGEVWSKYHAMNFCIVKNDDNEFEFWYIEPQNDKIFKNEVFKVCFIKL